MREKTFIATLFLLALAGICFSEEFQVDFDGKIKAQEGAKLNSLLDNSLNQNTSDVKIKNKLDKSGMGSEGGTIDPYPEENVLPPLENDTKGYYIVEPDNAAVYWFYVTTTGSNPNPWNVCLRYKLSAVDSGHDHTAGIPAVEFIYDPYPQSFCRYNVPAGAEVRWYFHPTAFAARMNVEINCSGSCEGQIKHTVDMKISGLVSLVDAPDSGYVLTGANTAHQYNHQATTTTAIALKWIGQRYRIDCPNGKPLRYNDFSLPWGGLFDIGPTGTCFLDEEHTKPCQFWNPPHSTHRYGWQADVGVNGVVPEECKVSLKKAIEDIGGRVSEESDHWHLDFTPKTDKHYEEELRCY